MSSLEQPAQKRPRRDSNNNDSAQNCNTPTNTNINLFSLPDEAINNIISYGMTQKECQVWEWIGILSQTCRSLRRLAQTYAPTRIVLKDFKCYTRLSNSERSVDVRIGFLESLRDHKWTRRRLKEFHVDPVSVLEGEDWRSEQVCNGIKDLLRTLITTEGSFPELEWIDIELQSKVFSGYDLIDAESLRLMPDALPALKKLCLSKCFKHGKREISLHQLRQFFTSLQTSLTSISICGPEWMTDSHIEAIMPIIGENLVRLELVDCMLWNNEEGIFEACLTDDSLITIAQYCTQLKSFSMVGSDITTRNLERLLSTNTGITTLNLSENGQLDTRTVNVISKHLPRLEELRNAWYVGGDWLSDDGLIALVDAQEKESDGSERICLKLLGLNSSYLTVRGIKHAIDNGVREIEMHRGNLYDSILDLGSDVKLYRPHTGHFIDGGLYEQAEYEY